MHFCHEELLAIVNAVPYFNYITVYVRATWHKLFGCSHEEQYERKIAREVA